MKINFLFALWAGILLSACTNDSVLPDPPVAQMKDTLVSGLSDLQFKVFPLSDSTLKFAIQGLEDTQYEVALLQNDVAFTKNRLIFHVDELNPLYTELNAEFSPNRTYAFLVKAITEDDDHVFVQEILIPYYQHQFINNFQYQTLAEMSHSTHYDLSPARKAFFFDDYQDNKPILKRLWLEDGKIDIFNVDLPYQPIRSKNEEHLIIRTQNFKGRWLQEDSCAILDYHLVTRDSVFIGWGSNDYDKFTRVINNSMFVVNALTGNAIRQLDLDDLSFTAFSEDYAYLNEESFDNIYYGNQIFNFTKNSFEKPIQYINNNTNIAYRDDNTDTYVLVESFWDDQAIYSRFVIYQQNVVVFEQPFEKGRMLSFPSIMNLSEGKMIFFQEFAYGPEVRLDGYYSLDLNTKEISFIQTDNQDYLRGKFDAFVYQDPHSFLSYRYDKIYKVTMP